MTVTIDLSPLEEYELSVQAARAGVSLSEYVRGRLLGLPTEIEPANESAGPPLSPLEPLPAHLVGTKPFNIMQFAGIARRSVEEIEAHIADVEASRNEWDQRDYRQMGLSQQNSS